MTYNFSRIARSGLLQVRLRGNFPRTVDGGWGHFCYGDHGVRQLVQLSTPEDSGVQG